MLVYEFSSLGAVAIRDYFADGVSQIWLDGVNCTGNESRLIDCPVNILGSHNCGSFDDAGVICIATTCTQGDVRLQGGSTPYEGFVEVCNSNIWTPLCEDFSWNIVAAEVVCIQLGFSASSNKIYL